MSAKRELVAAVTESLPCCSKVRVSSRCRVSLPSKCATTARAKHKHGWVGGCFCDRDSAALGAKTAHSGRSRSHKIKRKWTAVRAAVSLKLSCCLRRYPMETRLAYHCASEALAKLVKRALSLSCLLICYVYVAWASCLRHKPAGSQKNGVW